MISKVRSVSVEKIESLIILLRGEKAIIDSELAKIYGIPTARLNQQVRRNKRRFPSDFMFHLTAEEFDRLMLQNATSNPTRGGRRKLPLAFTEHGVLMAANVLNSNRAIRMSVLVVRAFVQLRKTLSAHKELTQRLNELEQKISGHDADLQTIIEAIHQIMAPPEKPKRPFGFTVEEPKVKYGVKKKIM